MAQPAAISLAVARGVVSTVGEPLIGSTESAIGALAMGDYDGDGDLDLFVGGRAIPQRYPESASSGLFRNDSGRFVLDAAGSAALRKVGLVSAALFADVDGDARADLVLAREWGALLLLLNDGHGGFSAAPASWGLEPRTSRWNGLASGDLDGDGRLDLIATSWGRNTATPADSTRPLVLVYGPFGSGGTAEMLLARDDPRVGALAPLNSFAQARLAIPDLVTRMRTFGAYADATIDAVLGPHASRAQRLTASALDHTIFFNRGDRFDAMPLPAEAQLAPAFYAGVSDFDGDGSDDVFLSQNFFPTAIGTPRYDAGRGLLLLGDGRGGLRPLSVQRAGIAVYGDQRGAAYADFDRDGRLDLVVTQNGAPTRLFRNRGAAQGLRVRLEGSDANPDAIGAQVRGIYGDRSGPVREIHAGSGYWSQNGAVQVLGRRASLTGVAVRWPGGLETRVPVAPGATEIVVRMPR
jgi:enediyne biosynthesis protein E4